MSERIGPTRLAGAMVAAIVALTLVLHFMWLTRFRHGYLTEWDESGYLQFALSNFDALGSHGLTSFARTVLGRGTYGPLLPFTTALAYPLVGRGVFGSLLVLPAFFAVLVIAAYGVARHLMSAAWAVVAALVVATLPGVTDYSRLFHFALPAATFMTAALWALLRSDGLARAGWSVIFGVFVALMCLSRTMTLGYIPGLALAGAAMIVVQGGEFRRRMRNFGFAGVAALVVAGPWYVRNARSVYDNLFHSGYGADAVSYGRHYPIASWGYWTKELRLDLSLLWLPLAVTLVLCFAATLAHLVVRKRRTARVDIRSARTAGIVALAFVVAEGYLALTSTRNEGTGFALPWLPALVILGVAAAATVPSRLTKAALATALVAVSLVAVLSKSGLVAPLASVRTVSVPGLGSTVVTDGRGLIQLDVASAGYNIGSPAQPLPGMHRRWLPLEHRVVAWSIREANAQHQPLSLVVGFDDLLFTNTTLILAAQLWFHRYLLVHYLHAIPAGDTIASYRHQLLSPEPKNTLITGEERSYGTISRRKVEAAAKSLGFVRMKSFRMPDGRTIWIWWRERLVA